jgi:hypothetical protein
LKKLAQTSYLKGGGFQGKPTNITINGQSRTVPGYGSAPRPASAAQMQGAGTLEDMLLQRLASGGSYMPQDLSGYATPGTAENIGRYAGTAASGLGILDNFLNQGGQGGVPGNVSQGGGNVISSILGGVKGGAKKIGGKILGGLRKLF